MPLFPPQDPDVSPALVRKRMNDDFYRLLMDESQMSFFDYDVDADDVIISCASDTGNRVVRRMKNYWQSIPTMTEVPAELRQSLLDTLRQYCARPQKGSMSICVDLFGRGEYRWYLVFFHSLAADDGHVNRIIGRMRDVQAEKLVELRLQSMSIYRRAVDSASLFVFEFELPAFLPRAVSDCNNANFFPGIDYYRHGRELIHPDDLPAAIELLNGPALLEAYRAHRYQQKLSFRLMNRSGEWNWAQLIIHLSYGGPSEARGIGYVQLIQDRKAMEERASTDCITGLFNRATTEELVEQLLQSGQGNGAFFIFDIDDFKSVNDTQGHAEGDRLLRDLAVALRGSLRQTDVLGRIGGDEFVALLPSASIEAARVKAEELLSAARAIQRTETENLTISMGVAFAPENGTTFDSLYRAADRALYRAKGLGKNRCCFLADE